MTTLALALCLFNASHRATRAIASQSEDLIPAGTYEESEVGLKKFLQDDLAALNAGDTARSARLQASLVIPNHKKWFRQTFGETVGPRLDGKYQQSMGQVRDDFPARLKENDISGCHEFYVIILRKPVDPSDIVIRGVTEAMTAPTPLYRIGCTFANGAPLRDEGGYFVYVEGGFRYIPSVTWRALRKQPKPMRIRVGGNVNAPVLIYRVLPVYPYDANPEKVKGPVRLHVIVGVHGTVEQITLINGHPLLVSEAINAVRQWRYQPTLLNGHPVEVDLDIDVDFPPRQ